MMGSFRLFPRRHGRSTSHTGQNRCSAEVACVVPLADVSGCSKLRLQTLDLVDHLVGAGERLWQDCEGGRVLHVIESLP